MRPEAGRLDPPERNVHLGARRLRVDVDQAGLRLMLETRRGAEARGEDRGREPERNGVGAGQRVVEVGPIVNESQFDEIAAAIERGRREGGTVIAGGERAEEEGYLIPPTVFEGVGDDAFLSCQEVFGPVASLYRFAELDEAIRRANAVEFGLSAAIFTSSLATATRFQTEAQAGLLHVNSQTAGAEVHVPFGGIKSSGWGPHEQGRAALEFYTEVVTLYHDV